MLVAAAHAGFKVLGFSISVSAHLVSMRACRYIYKHKACGRCGMSVGTWEFQSVSLHT